MGDWRKQWEDHADAEQARYDAMSTSALLDDVRRGRFGDYRTIWYALGKRAAAPEAAWMLFDVLTSQATYLDRYHCAAALLQLLGSTEWEPVELSAACFPVAENLSRVQKRIESNLGPR